MVDVKDELLIGDTALVLDHIDVDVAEFEELKKRIHFLESTLAKHANKHIVSDQEIKDADLMLRELDAKVMKPFEDHLLALKDQMMKPHKKYDNETKAQIGALIQTAELFLETAQARVESVEQVEHEWDAAEESAYIQDMIEKDEINEKKIFHKKVTTWKPHLKEKLETGETPKAPSKLK